MRVIYLLVATFYAFSSVARRLIVNVDEYGDMLALIYAIILLRRINHRYEYALYTVNNLQGQDIMQAVTSINGEVALDYE